MWHLELHSPHFSHEERKFLSRAGRATIPADILIERVRELVGEERPHRGRQSFLAHELHAQGLFMNYEEAFAFAESYYALAKGGQDFSKLTWDWE